MTSTSIETCERLAALARAGYPPRQALIELSSRMTGFDDAIASVGRRARLGHPIAGCLEPLDVHFETGFQRFVRCLATLPVTGADWARELEALAGSIRRHERREREASIAGAGATLSAKTIAALPFLMLPIAVKQLGDPAVSVCVALGLVLGYAGYRWLTRIVPSPPGDDRVAALADEVAAAVSAGITLDEALKEAAANHRDLVPAARRVHLGARWRDVLSEAFPEIGRAVHDATSTGTPVAESLRRTAGEIRQRNAQDFEKKVQRAPIRMVVPLVTCILPSFVLVAIVPLLRGLAHPA